MIPPSGGDLATRGVELLPPPHRQEQGSPVDARVLLELWIRLELDGAGVGAEGLVVTAGRGEKGREVEMRLRMVRVVAQHLAGHADRLVVLAHAGADQRGAVQGRAGIGR